MENKIRLRKLNEVIQLISGRDLPKDDYNSLVKGIPYIMGASNMSNGELAIERWTEKATVIGRKNDIVISVKGTVGELLILNEEEVHLSRQVMSIRVSENINMKYMYYYLKFYLSKIQEKAKGMIPGITREDILDVEFVDMDLMFQNKIVKILDKSQELIYKRKAQIEALNKLVKSQFIEMFGDPVINSKKYEVRMLEEICTKITDGTHNSPPSTVDGMPYVTAKHLKSYGLDFYSDPTYVSEEEHKVIYKRCNPEKGDVLYIKDGATTGIAAINNYDFEFSMLSSLALLKLDTNVVNNKYLIKYLNNKSIKEKIVNDMVGGAIKRLTLVRIKNIKVVIPPIELQNKFADFVNQIDKLKFEMQKSLEEMEINFDSLMQRAFKGELYK